jgi:hypothetical protein
MLFESWDISQTFDAILENVSGDIKDVQKDVDTIIKDLKDEGKDAETDEVKAAILMQAIDLADAGKDLEDLDIEKAKSDVKEGIDIRGQVLNESESAVVLALEVAGNILGNSALLEFITEKLEKLTGKSMDPGKIKSTIEGILGGISKVTGLPGKAISKFFSWVAGKFGANMDGKKAAELLGTGTMVVFLFAIGVANFPVLGSGVIWWVLSLTGLVGKSVELTKIYREIKDLITKAASGDEKAAETIGAKPEELEGYVKPGVYRFA